MRNCDTDMEKRILFVCLGNICRSPAAQGVMERLLDDSWAAGLIEVDSAGIGSWHAGQLPDRRMRDHARRRGLELTHRARQVRSVDFDRFDYIIGMDEENMYDLRRLAPSKEAAQRILCLADFLKNHPGQKTVPDPYYGGPADFELALDLIEDACGGLFDWMMQSDPKQTKTPTAGS
ncbi:MAG: low molecular weight phosphotyrosine protein phosphatase [Prevotella sp.]|nr:low molecular weight phosphotyrosine protein phosphatase [Prevotella sp.]